jgi:hypothetical protein
LATTKSSITLGWNEPISNGCPVTGFEILRNSGANDAVEISVESEITKVLPSLRQYQVDGLTQVGNTYKFKVRVFNLAGFTESLIANFVLAAVPDTPLIGP